MLANTVAKGEVEEEGLDSNPTGLNVALTLTNFAKVRNLYDAIPFRYSIL